MEQSWREQNFAGLKRVKPYTNRACGRWAMIPKSSGTLASICRLLLYYEWDTSVIKNHAENVAFNTERKGFVPLPILLRKLMRHLSAPELRVLVYLHLRASKFGICYPTQEEIAFELGLSGTKNLSPYIKSLEAKHLISTKTSMGRKYYLVHDPRVGLQHLANSGQLAPEELDEINHLCIDLGQEQIQPAS